ncbi:TonB-dependent receptor [Comamonas composti]|uniref:TonB-dependent receptor n=1 Tax=Comamonas composti TaxID=408558 RepID=UPI000687E5DD
MAAVHACAQARPHLFAPSTGHPKKVWVCSLYCAMLAAPWASAAEAGQPEPVLEQVEVSAQDEEALGRFDLGLRSQSASRLGLSLRETPAAVSVIEHDTIQAMDAQNTQQILQAVPGVTAHDAPGSTSVSYRGFTGAAVNQLFNGINLQYTIAMRPVDSWIYERVEAVGGASSFLYGAGGVGGTLNYITKLAQRANFGEAQLRLGEHGLKQASLGLNRKLSAEDSANAHHLRLDLNHRQAHSGVQGQQSQSSQLAASLLSDLGAGLSHTLAYEAQYERVDRPYWGTPVLAPMLGEIRIDEATRDKNYNSMDGMYAQRVQWLRSLTEWRVNDRLQFKNTFYAYDAMREYRNVEVYAFTPDNNAVQRSETYLQRHEQRLVGNRIEGSLQGELGGRRSDWAFGLDLSMNRMTSFPNSLPGAVSTVDPYDFATEDFYDIPGMTPGFKPLRENRVGTLALFVENRTALRPDLHLLSSLRHERIELEAFNRREVTASAPASFQRSYQPTTGRIGMVWDLSAEASLYAQYATAADPPSGMLTTAAFPALMSNTELTKGRQFELGSKLGFWQNKGTATLALYQITRRNLASADPQNTGQTLLVGQQSSRGLELSLGLALTPRWNLRADWSHVDARYDDYWEAGQSMAGKHPVGTPGQVANLWSSYQLTPKLQVTAGLRHVSRSYGDSANTFYAPAYTLLDLGLSYRISRNASLQARLRNATDRTYALTMDSRGMAYLGAARTADVSVQLRF